MDNATVGFVLLGAVIFCLVILNIMNSWRNYFNAGRFPLRYLGEGIKTEPLPKSTQMEHTFIIQVTIIESLGSFVEMENLDRAIGKLRDEITLAYGMSEVHITGNNTRPRLW